MTATAGAGSRLETRLRKTAPPAWFDADVERYEVDSLLPSLAVAPDSPEAVAAVLAEANAAGAAVIARGGGTQLSYGNPAERYDLALDLRRLDAIVAHEPADLTVTVQAGVRLDDVQRALAERGQWLPFDPPVAPEATIGGLLAANASGPARIAFGTGRDLVIGMTVATADGMLVKSGGRVVKNVAGYDLAKMHIGALGTLGIITQASFKVAPLPKATRTLACESSEATALVKLAIEVRDAALPATAIVLSRAAAANPRLLLRFAGGEAAVERAATRTDSLAKARGLTCEQAPGSAIDAADLTAGRELCARIAHRLTDTAAVLAAAPISADAVSYPTAGVSRVAFLAAGPEALTAVKALRNAAEAAGASLVIESGPIAARREVEVWGAPPSSVSLMRSLKQQMDPNGILSPGRFVGGI
ncbi:MAG TPA: FAD-binding protein [Dehalococcoidia bacterium]